MYLSTDFLYVVMVINGDLPKIIPTKNRKKKEEKEKEQK